MKFFENFDFLRLCFLKMCPIFVGSVHDFGSSDKMTLFSEKILISNKCLHGLMPNLIKKSWTVSNASMIHVRVLQQYIVVKIQSQG